MRQPPDFKNRGIAVGAALLAFMFGYETEAPASKLPSVLRGGWSYDCDGGNTLDINQHDAQMTVDENQIVISVQIRRVMGSHYHVLLAAPFDLGAGGQNLPWDKFSRTEPVADLDLNQKQQLLLVWHGFYDTERKAYKWQTDTDFYDGHSVRVLSRCTD